jgi:hypothetical protein
VSFLSFFFGWTKPSKSQISLAKDIDHILRFIHKSLIESGNLYPLVTSSSPEGKLLTDHMQSDQAESFVKEMKNRLHSLQDTIISYEQRIQSGLRVDPTEVKTTLHSHIQYIYPFTQKLASLDLNRQHSKFVKDIQGLLERAEAIIKEINYPPQSK